MKNPLFLIVCLISKSLFAQDMSYSKPGKTFYQQLPDPAITLTEEWSRLSDDINISFASDNVRYPKNAFLFFLLRLIGIQLHAMMNILTDTRTHLRQKTHG